MFKCLLNTLLDSQFINYKFNEKGEDSNDGNANAFLYGIVGCMALFLILVR